MYLSSLPSFNRIMALQQLQEETDAIDDEMDKERIALAEKYRLLKEDKYIKRKQIVSGEIKADDVLKKDETAEIDAAADADEEDAGVKGFWLQCLSSNSDVGQIITEEDHEALEALDDITCTVNPEYNSFTLSFYFKENDFFSNSVLEKTYAVSKNLFDDDLEITSVTSSQIEWKASKDLTVTEIKEKKKAKSGKNKGQVKTVTKLVPKPSFFHFFSEPDEGEDEEEDEDEDNEKEQCKLDLDQDWAIATSIRLGVIPFAIKYYMGELGDEYDDDYDEDEDDDEDEDEDEDEEDDEDDEDAPKKGKNKRRQLPPTGAFPPPPPGADGQQECKQS